MDFSFYPLRCSFRALDPVSFPPGQSANILRGAFGMLLRESASQDEYRRIFEPAGPGPSGLRDWPRPFVFRAAHLDGVSIEPGAEFYFDLNRFDCPSGSVDQPFREAFSQFAFQGLGPGRGRAELLSMGNGGSPPVTISLEPDQSPVSSVRVEFLTPTELKTAEGVTPTEFRILFARIRDRVSTLRALYGRGPLEIDFQEMGRRASGIIRTGAELRTVNALRRSSRTGQTHPIGGFTGWADYSGELTEFVPFLRVARWCGVGRQCVWGKGELRISGMNKR